MMMLFTTDFRAVKETFKGMCHRLTRWGFLKCYPPRGGATFVVYCWFCGEVSNLQH